MRIDVHLQYICADMHKYTQTAHTYVPAGPPAASKKLFNFARVDLKGNFFFKVKREKKILGRTGNRMRETERKMCLWEIMNVCLRVCKCVCVCVD